MLEARFASLNPFIQHMFLKLHDIEDPEKKAFILETLRIEFRDVAIEARKVLKRFNKLGSHIKVVSTNNEGTEIPIPSKLLGLYEVFENNFDWICPKIFLVISVNQSVITKGLQKLMWMKYNALLKRLLQLILMILSILLDSYFLRLAQRR
jgi:hypothetical protein